MLRKNINNSSAHDLIADRARTHGDVQAVANTSAILQAEIGVDRFPPLQRYVLQMLCVKLARITHGDAKDEDHWRDIEGYARLCINDLTIRN